MADIVIESDAYTSLHTSQTPRNLVWTSSLIGYIFSVDGDIDLSYRKTTDGGSSWGSKTTLQVGSICCFDIWFDKWTSGDSGDLVHITMVNSLYDDIEYFSFDTSDDTSNTKVTVRASTSSSSTGSWAYNCVSVTKSVGGNVYVGGWSDNAGDEHGFYRSTDNGLSFSVRSDMAEGVAVDKIMFTPGNDTDNQDIYCFYLDVDVDELSLKVYDDSANSWDETAIVSVRGGTGSFEFCAGQRHSDGHIILCVNTEIDDVTGDIKVYDINGASSITVKTDIATDTDDMGICSLLIDQNNDDLYISYLGKSDGSETWTSSVGTYYKKSDDGGSTWGSEIKISEDTNDDYRCLFAGISVGDSGGRFEPVWFNDDDNDLLCSYVNSISISAAATGTNLSVNIGDAWKDVDAMKINIGDSWRSVVAVKINIGDSWKDIII